MIENIVEVDKGVFVSPSEVCSVESNGYWGGCSPSDSYWITDGARIILKNGQKVYTKISATEVIKKLKQTKGE